MIEPPLTSPRNVEIVRRLGVGHTARAVADAFDISISRVHQVAANTRRRLDAAAKLKNAPSAGDPVETITMDTRMVNALKERFGPTPTVGDVCGMTERELLRLNGIGRKGVKQLLHRLAVMGTPLASACPHCGGRI